MPVRGNRGLSGGDRVREDRSLSGGDRGLLDGERGGQVAVSGLQEADRDPGGSRGILKP